MYNASRTRKPDAKLRLLCALVWTLQFSVLAGCDVHATQSGPTTASPVPPQVQTVKVKSGEAAYELRLPAVARAGEHAQIFARATGILARRQVDLGDWVSQGQVLAIVTAPEIDQKALQAKAELRLASANLALAQANFQRAEKLVDSGAIAREVYDERRATYMVDQASLASAEAQLANLQEQQGFQIVRAPFAGIISARNVDNGDRVIGDQAASSSPLFELNSLDPLRIVVDVPQSAVLQVHANLHAQVSFPEMGGAPMSAEVVRIAQSISNTTGGMRVELRLANPGNRIPAGMVGEVQLQVPRPRPAVIVPTSAVIQNASGAEVIRMRQDSRLDYRQVKLGRNLGNTIEILDGITAGDTLVLAPNALLKPNMLVNVAARSASSS